MSAPLVLIADDQADIVEALRLLLKAEGYRTASAHVPEGVVSLLEREQADAALIDLNYARDTTSGREGWVARGEREQVGAALIDLNYARDTPLGREGMDLLSRIRARDPTLPVIVM